MKIATGFGFLETDSSTDITKSRNETSLITFGDLIMLIHVHWLHALTTSYYVTNNFVIFSIKSTER